jgi:hypothetical protein
MNKKVIGMILQAPAVLLLAVSFFASTYAVISGSYGEQINWGTPVFLVIIIGLFFWGRWMENKGRNRPY